LVSDGDRTIHRAEREVSFTWENSLFARKREKRSAVLNLTSVEVRKRLSKKLDPLRDRLYRDPFVSAPHAKVDPVQLD
jgi:hypothetical protein